MCEWGNRTPRHVTLVTHRRSLGQPAVAFICGAFEEVSAPSVAETLYFAHPVARIMPARGWWRTPPHGTVHDTRPSDARRFGNRLRFVADDEAPGVGLSVPMQLDQRSETR